MFLLYQCHYKILVNVLVVSMSLYITGTYSCCINVIIYYRCMFLLYQCHFKIQVHVPVMSMSFLKIPVHVPVVSISL